MFFHISKQPQENYPCQWQLGSFAVSTDEGWKQFAIGPVQILYKGYADAGSLESLLGQVMFQSTPHLTGNFCALVVVNDTLTIQSDRYRGFPIYIDSDGINNLVATDRTAWTDSLITVHADLTVTENQFDVIGSIDTSELSFQQAQDQVHDILTRKTRQFLSHNTLPLKVFLTGGVDTMLVYSYLCAAGAEFELLDNFHFDHDYFWRANSNKITQYWAYNQTHHWRDPCVLMSGAPGDEFMLRNPDTGNLYLRHAGTSIDQLVQPHHMQHDYIKSELENNQLHLTDTISLANTKEQLHHQLCNTTINDWQHWHLSNTLHWTPLRDLDIFKIVMRLPVDCAADQILNSGFSTALIERNIPGGSKLISDQKNAGPELKNLSKLFDHHG
jgi:hypothetical protein